MDSPPAIAPTEATQQRKARIGCSGCAYQHWRGRFYPEDRQATRWLKY